MNIILNDDEKAIALKLWQDLKIGAPDAYARLRDTSENIREAILQALVEAVDKKTTPDNPFK